MSARLFPLLLLLAVAAVLAGGAWFVLDTDPVAEEESIGEPAMGPEASASNRPPTEHESQSDLDTVRDVVHDSVLPLELSESDARIRGRVVDAEGHPILAEVLVGWDQESSPPGWATPEEGSESGAEEEPENPGRCELSANGQFVSPALPAWPDAHLTVSATGYGTERRELALVSGRELDLGTLILHPECRVAGRVQTLEGTPITAAVVRDRSRVWGTCDEQGRFEITGLPAVELWLFAEAEGFAALTTPPLRVRGGESVEDLVLLMDTACFIEGVVLGLDRAPVENVSLTARLYSSEADEDFARRPWGRGAPGPEARSDEEGRFRLGPLVRGRVEVHASALGYDREEVRVESDATGVEIELESRALVFGTVVDASGAPVELNRVQLIQGREEQGDWQVISRPVDPSQRGSARGEFELTARTGRLYRVLAEGPEIARTLSESFKLEENSPYGPLTMRAADGVAVSGIVVDDLGVPLPGATISISEVRGTSALPMRRDLRLASVEAGPDGRFETPPLLEAQYQFQAQQQGSFSREPALLAIQRHSEPEELVLVMDRGGWITGEVRPDLLGIEGSLHIKAEPDVEDTAGLLQKVATASIEGRSFRVGPLRPGAWKVSLIEKPERERSYSRWRSGGSYRTRISEGWGWPSSEPEEPKVPWVEHPSVEVQAGAETWILLSLGEGQHTRVFGQLHWDGRPLPFGRVQLSVNSLRLSCTTDRAGFFEFEGALEGRILLSATDRPGRPYVGYRAMEIASGSETNMDLHIGTGVVRGRVVVVPGDVGMKDATITVQVAGPPEGASRLVQWARIRSDENGDFELIGVPSGTVRIGVSRRGYAGPGSADGKLSAGGVLAMATVSLIQGGNLTARYQKAERFELRAVKAGSEEVRTARSRRGTATISTMLPGEWSVELLVDDSPVESRDVRITAGKTENLQLD